MTPSGLVSEDVANRATSGVGAVTNARHLRGQERTETLQLVSLTVPGMLLITALTAPWLLKRELREPYWQGHTRRIH